MRRRGAEEEHHVAPGCQRLIGERAHAGHAQPTGDQQHVAAARVDLEAAPEGTEHLVPLAPGRMRASHACPRR